MKYIKQYEATYNQPKIGDYVLCELDPIDNSNDNTLTEYVKTHIGQLVGRTKSEIEINKRKKLIYSIRYKDITPDDYRDDFAIVEGTDDTILVWRKEIKHWTKNKEELEIYLIANQYNL